MKKLLFTLTLLLMAFMTHAATEINGIYYNLDSSTKTAEVTENPNYYSGSVSIPSKVTYSGYSYSVTSIGDWAFNCSRTLASITIPNSVTGIGERAFGICERLTSITIPASVTSIGNSAFYFCDRLTSVTIPNSVTNIGIDAFSGCSNLTTIKVDANNPKYDSRNNCNAIIETTSNTLISGCKNTIIPNSVTSIGEYAFSECFSLTSVTIPNSVTSIGEGAFRRCIGLTSIDLPNSVTSIGEAAFYRCSGLTSITIPNSVTSIGQSAFYECSSLTSITIPNSVTSIGNGAFEGCSSLTSVDLPNSVTSIGNSAFYRCSSLTSVDLPNSVTSIGNSAFYRCSGLTSVTIPNSVKSIGTDAFSNCTSLTSVTVENPNPVTIEQNTFSNRANATLYVPTGSKSAYQAANYWKEFKEIIEKNMSHDAGLGDVNGDGEISISDVTLLVDYLLEQAGDNFILANADVNKDGRISVSDAVSIIKLILEGDIEPQAYLTCPDDHHPHMIDLGLPSGTKWACCNVGADKPEAYGGYYAWGETEEKLRYDWSTYIHCDGSSSTCHDLGSDIAGTQYDVAHVKWGGSWVMPSYDQYKELIVNCGYGGEWITMNGIEGRRFTGKNGGSIFLPAAGYRRQDNLNQIIEAGCGGEYWLSTQFNEHSAFIFGFEYFISDYPNWCGVIGHCFGRSVRPVSR